RHALRPRVEAAPRDLEDLAQNRHWKGGLLHRDERKLHVVSLAKKAVAFRRMSRSICRTLFSRRSRASSSLSAFVSAPFGAFPASAPAALIHSRTAVSVRSSSRASCPAGFPLVCASRTTSALYSGVKCLRFLFAPMKDLHSVAHLGLRQVSKKPGQLQMDLEVATEGESTTADERTQHVPLAHVRQLLLRSLFRLVAAHRERWRPNRKRRAALLEV